MTTSDHRSDIELLRAYERNGDEAAFGALAARHVDMIFAVSLRRSGDRQLAEEATQNVLIALCKSARKFNAPESNLTAWLHTSTKFEIAKLQRRESRLKQREQAYATDNMNTSLQDDDKTFQRLLPLLDQAIDSLRAPDREVIVRRYLEGQDFRNIGKALGITEDAAQKRTSRAFDVLNQFSDARRACPFPPQHSPQALANIAPTLPRRLPPIHRSRRFHGPCLLSHHRNHCHHEPN